MLKQRVLVDWSALCDCTLRLNHLFFGYVILNFEVEMENQDVERKEVPEQAEGERRNKGYFFLEKGRCSIHKE